MTHTELAELEAAEVAAFDRMQEHDRARAALSAEWLALHKRWREAQLELSRQEQLSGSSNNPGKQERNVCTYHN